MSGYIRLEHVWKRFRKGEVHDSVRDLVPAMLRGKFGRRREVVPDKKKFWALRDVNFEVLPGQALGIIGPNGAGKSTVLKVLTRILDPSHGSVDVRGRVGSLIELAAGFHPDLTGRENVFLQGALMGMPRADIAKKFDQIVDFSGVEAFIDTPVKRYSSGMNARLGFAIASHVDPDVLIIDEVLSVGDTAFQIKAFERITELVRREIPVVVVSHQMPQLVALCTHALVMDHGRIVQRGTPSECVAGYLERVMSTNRRHGEGAINIVSVNAWQGSAVRSGERLVLSIECSVRDDQRTEDETIGIRLRSDDGTIWFETDARRAGIDLPQDKWYWFDLSVQLNVPAGGYVFESFVWNSAMNAETEAGPTIGVNVLPGRLFSGPVQLNAKGWITHAAQYGEAAGWAAPNTLQNVSLDEPVNS